MAKISANGALPPTDDVPPSMGSGKGAGSETVRTMLREVRARPLQGPDQSGFIIGGQRLERRSALGAACLVQQGGKWFVHFGSDSATHGPFSSESGAAQYAVQLSSGIPKRRQRDQ